MRLLTIAAVLGLASPVVALSDRSDATRLSDGRVALTARFFVPDACATLLAPVLANSSGAFPVSRSETNATAQMVQPDVTVPCAQKASVVESSAVLRVPAHVKSIHLYILDRTGLILKTETLRVQAQ